MKKLLCIIIILLSISYAQTKFGVIKLKNGEVFQVKIKGVYEEVLYYELLLRFEQGNIYSVPCDVIVSINVKEKNIMVPLDLDCSKNTYDPPADAIFQRKSESQFQQKPESQINLTAIGSILIAASGTIGLINLNRECDDCTEEKELEDFLDSIKFWGNINYAALAIGGILIFIDSLPRQQTVINNQKTINK